MLSYSRNEEFAVHLSEAVLDVIACNNSKSYDKVHALCINAKQCECERSID